MANLDDIFEKSNLDEGEKKSKTIFGKLLIKLRQKNLIKLYSVLGGVEYTNFKDGVFYLSFKDKATYELVDNANDIKSINEILEDIESGISVSMNYLQDKVFDCYSFKEYLKKEFGKILTIK